MESVGRTGGNVVLFHHMEALAKDGHEVRMVSPFGELRWSPGMLAQIDSAAKLVGYDGIWRPVKRTQSATKNVLPWIERKIMACFRGDAHRRSANITRRLLARWQNSDITVATHSFTAQ